MLQLRPHLSHNRLQGLQPQARALCGAAQHVVHHRAPQHRRVVSTRLAQVGALQRGAPLCWQPAGRMSPTAVLLPTCACILGSGPCAAVLAATSCMLQTLDLTQRLCCLLFLQPLDGERADTRITCGKHEYMYRLLHANTLTTCAAVAQLWRPWSTLAMSKAEVLRL